MRKQVWQSRTLALAVAVTTAGSLLAAPAMAAEEAGKHGGWIRLCEPMSIVQHSADGKVSVDKDGKPIRAEKKMCLTQQETIDGRTGIPVVSAALREIEGDSKKTILVGLPLGMFFPAGAQVAFHTAAEWEKLTKDSKADTKSIKWTKLEFIHCLETNCFAEAEATPDVVKSLEAGAMMTIAARSFNGRPVQLPVPLKGFTAARKGEPMELQKYVANRRQMLAQIRERQKKAAMEAQAAEQQKTKKQ